MINYASIPVYIRFGEIPQDAMSSVHRSDYVVRKEGGLSVWRAVKVDGKYFPVLPDEPNENSLADYFNFLIDSDTKVYLVTGTEIFVEGACREPLLINPIVLKEITHYYRPDSNKMVYSKIKDLIKRYVSENCPDDKADAKEEKKRVKDIMKKLNEYLAEED